MKYRTVIRDVSILYYREDDRDQYEGSMQIQISGHVGTIHSLTGTGFYQVLKTQGFDMFKDLGLKRISVAVSEAHLRLIEWALKGVAKVENKGSDSVAGRNLIRIELSEA